MPVMNFEFTTLEYDKTTFLAEILPSLPKGSAVYKIFDTRGQLIILDKTSNLFNRLDRYFGPHSERVKDLDLREITSRIDFRRTWSPFETAYVLYVQRRDHFPRTYRRMRTFRLFKLMKINRRQRFPRLYASKQIKAGVDYFGPFVTRGQFGRLKTSLERTFKLRPCLYNIRGGDPHPDCLYFQMHTCSRPCNDDVPRERYLRDVQSAIGFIQGQDEELTTNLMKDIRELAAEEKFEQAELARRQLEKIERARKEAKDKFYSVWSFNYLVLLPSETTARTKVAFVRSGGIVRFDEFETATLTDAIPDETSKVFSTPEPPCNREWQYDEFCLVANYLVHPLKSVELVPVGNGTDLGEYFRKRALRKSDRQSHADS
jgi:excinuclease ABC subunit C